MKRTLLPLIVLVPVALAGCQTIKAHNPFRHKGPAYEAARQEQPLEVPPGMNEPPTAEALTIPAAGGAPVAGNPGRVPAPQPTSTAPPAAGAAPAAMAAGGGSSFTLADTPDSAYHRVGLALSRGDVGQVIAHDDTAHSYQVAVDSIVKQKSEGGFFHRMFHRDKNVAVTGTVTVQVVPQASGSLVQASGNPDAVQRVMGLLQQRLGGG